MRAADNISEVRLLEAAQAGKATLLPASQAMSLRGVDEENRNHTSYFNSENFI